MTQTYYRRPYALWVPCAIVGVLLIAYVALACTVGITHTSAWIVIILALTVSLAAGVLDPETCFIKTVTLDDGRRVKAKQPLIGFKRHEILVGTTGGYEVSLTDGYRREPALLRI